MLNFRLLAGEPSPSLTKLLLIVHVPLVVMRQLNHR